jgi:hypothetical protein
MVDFEHWVAMMKGMRANKKEMKDKMDSKVEVKASHKKMEATMKTNQEHIAEMIADREEIKAIRGSLVRKDEGPLGEAGN